MTDQVFEIHLNSEQLAIIHAALKEHQQTNNNQAIYSQEQTEELDALIEMSGGKNEPIPACNGWCL